MIGILANTLRTATRNESPRNASEALHPRSGARRAQLEQDIRWHSQFLGAKPEGYKRANRSA